MKKLLACVLSLSFCTFVADARFIDKVKSGVKKVGSKIGKSIKKSVQGNAEEEQNIANSAVGLYNKLGLVQSEIKELAPSDILLITRELQQIFQDTLSSIDKSKVHNVEFDEGTYKSAKQIEKTILKGLNKGLGFSEKIKSCEATYSKEEYDQLAAKIEDAVKVLSSMPKDVSESTASNILRLHPIKESINEIIKTIRNLKVAVTVEESESTQGAEADDSKNSSTERTIEIKAVEEEIIKPLSNALKEFEQTSGAYFDGYTSILDLMIAQLGSSNDVKLKEILTSCKNDLSQLPVQLDIINTYELNPQSQLSQYRAQLNQWIHPPSEKIQGSFSNLSKGVVNAGNNMMDKAASKSNEAINGMVQETTNTMDKLTEVTNHGFSQNSDDLAD